MGDLLAVVFGFILLIGACWVIADKLGMLKPGPGKTESAEPDSPAAPYKARARVLSPAESSFHGVLGQALPILTATAGKDTPPLLLAKVRLADIFDVDATLIKAAPEKRRGAAQSAQNRVAQKHVDFLLCAPDTTRPLLLIELDDASHERQSRKDRDAFVDRAAASAGIPVLHVKAAAAYQPRAIAAEMMAAMGAKAGGKAPTTG